MYSDRHINELVNNKWYNLTKKVLNIFKGRHESTSRVTVVKGSPDLKGNIFTQKQKDTTILQQQNKSENSNPCVLSLLFIYWGSCQCCSLFFLSVSSVWYVECVQRRLFHPSICMMYRIWDTIRNTLFVRESIKFSLPLIIIRIKKWHSFSFIPRTTGVNQMLWFVSSVDNCERPHSTTGLSEY